MAFDAHANLALAPVLVPPSPALSGTSLIITGGYASLFPAVPFNCTVYPGGVTPTAANAEIVRVTNITGDVFTITRAQEGTTAKAIASGWQIANTVSVKVITDIENAFSTIGGIQSLSAGTAVATDSQIIFANSNGVSFGVSSNVITASFSGGGGGGGAAISAGANSQSTGTVVFSNSNGVTFGLSNDGMMTASHNGITSQSNQAASASNGSFAFQTLGFSNANGVTFGTSAGSIITASIGTAAAGNSVNFSAGTTSNDVGSIVFSNSNGITFGLDGSTITAQHNGLTSQSNQAASASNGSFAFQTLAFSNANNVTFGTSAGSIITASVNAAAGGSINFSAGTTSNNLNSIVFSNSNGVSFGLDGSTITASASGGGGGVTLSQFSSPQNLTGAAGAVSLNAGNVSYAQAFILPQAVSFDYVRFQVLMFNNQLTVGTIATAAETASVELNQTFNAVIYSFGTGASSQSLFSVTSGSAGSTWMNSISISNSTQASYTIGVTSPLRGGSTFFTTAYSVSATNYSFTTNVVGSNFSGTRMFDIPISAVLPPGNYWMIAGRFTSSQSAGPAALSRISSNHISMGSGYFGNQIDVNPQEMGTVNTNQLAANGGAIFSTAVGGTVAALNFSNLSRAQSCQKIYFQLLASQ